MFFIFFKLLDYSAMNITPMHCSSRSSGTYHFLSADARVGDNLNVLSIRSWTIRALLLLYIAHRIVQDWKAEDGIIS